MFNQTADAIKMELVMLRAYDESNPEVLFPWEQEFALKEIKWVTEPMTQDDIDIDLELPF